MIQLKKDRHKSSEKNSCESIDARNNQQKFYTKEMN